MKTILTMRSKRTSAKNLLLALAMLGLAGARAGAQDLPPRGYESWGVCPFECCTYRDWRADEDMAVHAGRDDNAPVVFRLRRGEAVDGVTGVVVANQARAIRIDRDVRDGFVDGSDVPQLALRAGDVVYMLAPLGEGFYRYWYKGKVYRSGSALTAMPAVQEAQAELVWWKQVRNKAGQQGWTRSEKFAHVDACG